MYLARCVARILVVLYRVRLITNLYLVGHSPGRVICRVQVKMVSYVVDGVVGAPPYA